MTLDHRQQPPATHVDTTDAHAPQRPAPWIVADNLTKRFGHHTAVDGLTFQVPRGVVTGFLGPNGSGKTTTMRGAAHVLRPRAESPVHR